MRKVTRVEIAEFERDLLFKQIANPDYRYGQAFLNYFPWVHKALEEDGDLGQLCAHRVWGSNNPKQVFKLLEWYIEL